MDAYPAGSLAQLLRSLPPLDLGAVVTALTPVGSALEHLHRLGACHGDVSAANILLSYEGRPVLSDLGDAALLGMESAHGSSDDDVAALAAVAWELLTGQRPDQGPHRAPARRPAAAGSAAGAGAAAGGLFGAPLGQRPSAEEFAVESTAVLSRLRCGWPPTWTTMPWQSCPHSFPKARSPAHRSGPGS